MTTQTNGVAKKNDVVTYEDMANPRQAFLVVGFVASQYGPGEFALLNLETDEMITSDLRQHGWKTVMNVIEAAR